ncbi:hypothetical protein [Helicobacter trogontum]
MQDNKTPSLLFMRWRSFYAHKRARYSLFVKPHLKSKSFHV